MKHKKFSPDGKPADAQTAPNGGGTQTGIGFTPCPEEVARTAYFAYVNEGAPEGRAVQHWLDAEARLIKERDRTRVHGFHNRT
jgi:hypothetical protein